MFTLPPDGFLHLPGPQFLAFYGIIAAVVLAAASLLMFFADTTETDHLPNVPTSPDAIEIAYLSGGVNAVLRTVVYDLRQQNLLVLEDEKRLIATRTAPVALTRLQRRVLDAVQYRPEIKHLFADKALRSSVEAILEPVRARLAADDLLQPATMKRTAGWVLGFGLLVLLGLAAAKLWIAHLLGKSNIGGLIFLAAFSSVGLLFILHFFSKGVVSRRGDAFLRAMRLAYSTRLQTALMDFPPIGSGGDAMALDRGSLFLIALFGFEALRGTPDAAFARAFSRSDGGGCSSGGCGGGDGGGGDGGGGCGGCGGGGD